MGTAPCSQNWNYVTCTTQSVSGRVTRLALNGLNLNGTILSTAWYSLNQLSYFSLGSNNYMHGFVPSNIGLLTTLTYLNLGTNVFTSTLPTELGLLTKLSSLFFDHNVFTGTIPPQIESICASISNSSKNAKCNVFWDTNSYCLITGNGNCGSAACPSWTTPVASGNPPYGQCTPSNNDAFGLYSFKMPLMASYSQYFSGWPSSGTTPCTGTTENWPTTGAVYSCSSGGRVTLLDVISKGYSALLSGGLSFMDSLQELNLRGNSWYSYPDPLYESINRLTMLTLFNIDYNNGPVLQLPTQIFDLPNLVYLDITAAKFSGNIPTSIGLMTQVTYFEFEVASMKDLELLVGREDVVVTYLE